MSPRDKKIIAWFGLALILLGIGLTIYQWGPTWFPKDQKDTNVSMIEPQRSASPTVTKTSRCSTEIRRVRVGNDLAKIDWKGCRLVLELEDERARIKILTGPDKYNLTLESGPGGYKKGDRLKIRNIRYRSIYIQTIQPGTQANVIFILCPLTSEIKGMGCVLLDGSFHGLYGAQTRPREKSTRFENGDSHNANPRFFFYF